MATQVGLSAVLKFAGDAAVAGMNRASGAFRGLSAQAKHLKAGMRDVKQGLSGMTIAGAAVAAGAGFTVKKFADFDGQMAAVKAVLGKAQKDSFPGLTREAERLGATTAFTATQAAEAMENLARAGLKPKQILSSIGPVLDAAAAEGMNLATAADIVASNIKAFGLEASEAARVADTLAFVSAKTNTSMSGLQEGLKFAAPVAKQLGFTIEDTAASLGVLADVGLKGGLAGTGLKNAMLKIAAGAKNGRIKIGQFSMSINDASGNLLPLNKIMAGIAQKLNGIPKTTDRASAAMKLLGLRGMGASAAFDALAKDPKKIAELFGNMAKNAKGSAKEMAKMRLNSLKGRFTLLSSAVDGVVNAMGKALSQNKSATGVLTGLTRTLGSAAKAFQFFGSHPKEIGKSAPIAIQGVSKEMMAFVRGVLRGIGDVKKVFAGLGAALKRVASIFGLAAGEGSSGMARMMTAALGTAAVIAPIGLAVKGVTKLFGPFARVGVGALKIVGGAAGGLAKMLGKVGGGILNKVGFASKLPGIAGKLGGAVKGIESLTAAPVRVVNLHEIGGPLGGLGAAGGAGQVGMLARARVGLAGFMLRFGRVGAFFNSGLSGIAGASTSLAGKLGRLAGAGGAIAAAGVAGFAFGSWLDKKFGISDKLANSLHNLFRASEIAASKQRVKEHADQVAIFNAQKMANTFARLSQKGVTSIGTGKGKQRVALTQEFAKQRISLFLKKQGKTETQIADILKTMEGTFRGIKDKGPVKVVVNVDGKQIASATAKHQKQTKDRGIKRSPAGANRRTALGATP